MLKGTVSQLFCYPIKSCGGIKVEQTKVMAYGVENDRRFMVADMKGKLVSKRECKDLRRVTVSESNGTLTIHHPDLGSIQVSLRQVGGHCTEVDVHKSKFLGFDQGPEASIWFTKIVGEKSKLVYVHEGQMRNKLDRGITFKVACHDSSPIHLVNSASIAKLQVSTAKKANGVELGVERFRPNIVVDGFPAWSEENWEAVTIGDVVFKVRKMTPRCGMINVNDATGELTKDPLATLAKRKKVNGQVCFGIYLLPMSLGKIFDDDDVDVRVRE